MSINSNLKILLDSELKRLNWNAARIAIIVTIIIIPASLVFDVIIVPDYFSTFLIGRSAIVIACGFLAAFVFTRKFYPHGDRISLILLIIVCVVLNLMLHRIGTLHPYYAMLMLLLIASLIFPWSPKYSVIASSAIIVSYVVPPLFIQPSILNKPLFFIYSGFLLESSAFVIIITVIQARTRSKEILNRLTIARQAQELEERDKYKREFISNITHELKTPLSIVIGNVDIIMETLGELQPRIMEQARQVQQAAFQLASHVDRIIAVSNIDDPMVKLDLQNYNYSGVVQNLFSLFVPKAREEKIAYTLNCPEKPLVVNVDIIRIEEVLTNLIQNAFKFSVEGGAITVNVATDGQKVVTEVADTGMGIPEEKQARIFDRMFQADDVLSKRHGGMGLGLYIVKKNVELHGGTVGMDSREGKGTSFRFSLPLYVDQTVPVKNEPYRDEDRRQARRRSGRDRRDDERRRMFEYQQSMGLDDLAKMSFTGNIEMFENMSPSLPTVLVVEDNPGMMKVVIESLRHEYNLLLGRDAFEALDKLKACNGKISLILSDIMLPGMSGFDFCGKVMENEEWKRIPLIFVTALMSEEDQLRGFGLGATDYITKPYNIKILKEKVDHWISRRQYEAILENMSQELDAKVGQVSRVKDIILHEIRNPMAIISAADSLITMVKEEKGSIEGSSKIEQYMESLRDGIKSLNSVLETTRRLDIGAMAVRRPETVESFVNEAAAQTRHLTGEVKLTIEMDQTSGVLVKADRRMLVQVLVNIIRNAVEAINERKPAGGGIITISCAFFDDRQIALRISDNGIGMDENVRQNIFRFKYTTKCDGTGVGLHLSKMLIKLHDGTIEVDSKKGCGSTFTMYLPVC
ncbi:MAG: response regulator [Chitinispirillaceae bacterium]|nr:response regulator [Chitinispirillaceae bacterium]